MVRHSQKERAIQLGNEMKKQAQKYNSTQKK
jgi:hypothetical protein